MATANMTTAEIAYLKWEQAGKPEGRDIEFWIEAEKEVNKKEPLHHRQTRRPKSEEKVAGVGEWSIGR